MLITPRRDSNPLLCFECADDTKKQILKFGYSHTDLSLSTGIHLWLRMSYVIAGNNCDTTKAPGKLNVIKQLISTNWSIITVRRN
jgi:hypothetical protein